MKAIYVGVAGLAGLGLYLVLKNSFRHDVSTAIARDAGVPEPEKLSPTELIVGSIGEYFERARKLDDKMRKRHPGHYKRWKHAIKMKWRYYAVEDPNDPAQVWCWETATGEYMGAGFKCPDLAVAAARLEGW